MADHYLTIYRSSAGSGKTFTLVKEYIKFCLSYPTAFKRILAITFTNKATEEMKSRVVDHLVTIASGKMDTMAVQIMKETGLDEGSLTEKAGQAIKKILHNYSDFSISTIDSFFGSVIRSLTSELDLPVRFNIELDTQRVIEQTVSMTLSDFMDNEILKNWLEEFVLHQVDEGKNWNVEPEMSRIGQEILKDEYFEIFGEKGFPHLSAEFVASLKETRARFRDQMASLGKRFTDVMQDHHLEHRDFYYSGAGSSKYFSKIQDCQGDEDYIYGKRVELIASDLKKLPKGDSPNKETILEIAEERFLPIMQEAIACYDENYSGFVTSGAILKTIYVAGLLSYLNENLVKLRKQEDILLISDTARILSRSVSSHDAFFIFEKTGNRYSHFLLDEFQDTSQLQWKCMLPLIINSMGEGKRSLIVGDIKQSIYRWRGGDMRLLQEGVDADLSIYRDHIRHDNLLTNFRSGEHIVEFNNAFFPAASGLALPELDEDGKRLLSFAYDPENLSQSVVEREKGRGFVKLDLIRTEKNDAEGENAKWKDISLERMLSDIRDLNAKGYTYRDICILTYRNSESTEIISFLRSHGITRLISSEVLNINGSMDVRLILAVVRYAFDRTDKASAYLIGRYMSENKVRPMFSEDAEPDIDSPGFASILTEIMSMTAYEAIERLMLIFRLSSSPDPFLQKLLQLGLSYDTEEGHGIYGFLNWLSVEIERDSSVLRVDLPSEQDSITIMTIHRSKGLEFPVVMLPFMKSSLDGNNKTVSWIRPENGQYSELPAYPIKYSSSLEHSHFSKDYFSHRSLFFIDNINVLYVAFTRAAERLYVNLPVSKDHSKISSVENLIPNVLPGITGISRTETETGITYVYGSDIERSSAEDHERYEGEIITVDEWEVSSWENRLWGVINQDRISVKDKENDSTRLGRVYHHLMDLYHSGTEDMNELRSEAEKWLNESEMITRAMELVERSIVILEKENMTTDNMTAITEAEILSADGRLLRPDLLLTSGKKAVVIDYKTGGENESHTLQVSEYMQLVRELEYEEVLGYLLYPSEDKLVRVA